MKSEDRNQLAERTEIQNKKKINFTEKQEWKGQKYN